MLPLKIIGLLAKKSCAFMLEQLEMESWSLLPPPQPLKAFVIRTGQALLMVENQLQAFVFILVEIL